MSGGVAIIRVGAATEVELKEKKHRVEDALSATRAAVEEGIVAGGGVSLVNAVQALDGLEVEYADERTGLNILRTALEKPMKGIVENAGMDGAVVIAEIRRRQAETGDTAIAYDVMGNRYVDMFEAGLIYPAKVTRSAVENATSIAAMIQCLVGLGGSEVARMNMRLRYASDIEALWYLRMDLRAMLVPLRGEAVANATLTQLTPLFQGHLPRTLGGVSRPANL